MAFRGLAVTLCLLLLPPFLLAAPDLVILVRHAQKSVAPKDNPPRETAAPLAAATHIVPIVTNDDPVTRIRAMQGGTVVIVGHSNTLPGFIKALEDPPASSSVTASSATPFFSPHRQRRKPAWPRYVMESELCPRATCSTALRATTFC